MSSDRDRLIELVRALPDDTVSLVLDLLRQAQPLTWTCHVCGDERPDDKISVASATFPIGRGIDASGTVNRRYCNDRPACAAKARVDAAETAARIGAAGQDR